MRAGLNAHIAADAVGRILYDGVFVDAKDVHLAQDSLRAGFHTLPAGLADMCVNEDVFRLVLGLAIGWISFHERKGIIHPCIKTITIVKKSFTGADSAERYRCNAEIRRKIMLWDSCYHLRMFLQQQLVAFLR